MYRFFVNMQKRGDGLVYADLHKSDNYIYFSAEDAQAAIDKDPELKPHRHVVELLAMLPDAVEHQYRCGFIAGQIDMRDRARTQIKRLTTAGSVLR